MDELLRLENIHYTYDGHTPALSGVSAAFHKGERIAVLGNNGAGKSTFFLCCNRILSPKRGQIFLRNQEITSSKKAITALRQAVGLVFQDPDSQMIAGSVESEVSFGPMNLRLHRDEVVARVERSLAQMNLSDYAQRAPQYLSGGEKKRVSIADILAMQSEIMLFDEPTASLDPQNTALLEQTLMALSREGITLVISTHDVDFAYRFATRALVFHNGEIIVDANIDEVFASKDMLDCAGLKQPSIYAIFCLLQDRFPATTIEHPPKNIIEMQRYIHSL